MNFISGGQSEHFEPKMLWDVKMYAHWGSVGKTSLMPIAKILWWPMQCVHEPQNLTWTWPLMFVCNPSINMKKEKMKGCRLLSHMTWQMWYLGRTTQSRQPNMLSPVMVVCFYRIREAEKKKMHKLQLMRFFYKIDNIERKLFLSFLRYLMQKRK